MDGVVSEGLATVFERDVGGRKTPWGDYPEDVGCPLVLAGAFLASFRHELAPVRYRGAVQGAGPFR
ncbi:hypothetical protein [uncultured Marinobacter sp.]|jgi:hypothetical protein|uniref:hypothetical protein n=1 Tax=uncultured Marinobacter sp. TaxID=187379 RepID=UPI002588C04B|nr:hypothetical protein [uncultured Marinobacter sp.]